MTLADASQLPETLTAARLFIESKKTADIIVSLSFDCLTIQSNLSKSKLNNWCFPDIFG